MPEKKMSGGMLIAAILFAVLEILGAALLIFAPVRGTGNGGFVPAAMIVIAAAAVIAFLLRQKQSSAPKPTAGVAGMTSAYYILLALSMIFSRFNRVIADTFLLSGAICVCCTSIAQYIASRKKG